MTEVIVPTVPVSSEEEGNIIPPPQSTNRQVSPAIRWCFTLNNYDEQMISSIVPIMREKCRMAVFGRERAPTTGTPHLQGYLEFKVKSRPIGVFGIPAMSWQKAKGDKQSNIVYCTKEDSNPFTLNCRVKKAVRVIADEQLYWWQKDIVNIVKAEPDDRKVYWYWSVAGGVGKTQFCKYLTVKYGAICLHGKGADVRNGVCEYLNKNGDTPHLVVYPIPRCKNSDYVSYESIENVKDMYFYSGKYEGGMVCGNPPHVIIFANEPPDESKLSCDRWEIVQIDS